MPPKSPVELFWRHVIPEPMSGCFLWIGAGQDYGNFTAHGKEISAHRFAWELDNGKVQEGLCVLHKCDNKKCVNVQHLFLGTQAENVADRDQKKRGACGQRTPSKKLTDVEVFEIRHAFDTAEQTGRGREGMGEVARSYGVSYVTVNDIGFRRRWKHLPEAQ